MRKILFRGRDLKGRWRVGSLIVVRVEKPTHKDVLPYDVYFIKGQDLAGEEHEVDPKTIGQLVFPATKMHPDIWEGDIIKDKDGRLLNVVFEPYIHAFNVIVRSKNRGISLEYLDEGYLHFRFKNHGAKVIGNIHDNLELINDVSRAIKKKV